MSMIFVKNTPYLLVVNDKGIILHGLLFLTRGRSFIKRAFLFIIKMFDISTQAFGAYELLRIADPESGSRYDLIPAYGATLNDTIIRKHGREISVIEGYASPGEMENHRHPHGYRSALLMPFPDRVADGRYSFGGREYQLGQNFPGETASIHGFMETAAFELKNTFSGPKGLILELEHCYDGHRGGYPWPFTIRLIMQFAPFSGFSVKTVVENTGKETMPLGLGWHHYFRTGSRPDELMLQFMADSLIELDGGHLPTGKETENRDFNRLSPIGQRELAHCYSLLPSDLRAETLIFDREQDLRISAWQDTGPGKFNYLQLYIPPARTSIAVEPLTCPPDAFNTGKGLINLKAGEKTEMASGFIAQ